MPSSDLQKSPKPLIARRIVTSMMAKQRRYKEHQKDDFVLQIYFMGCLASFSCAFLPTMSATQSKACFAITAVCALIGLLLSSFRAVESRPDNE